MQSRLAFMLLFISICGFGSWMLAKDSQPHSLADADAGTQVTRIAYRALDSGDVSGLLRWVRPDDHARLREMFERVQHLRQRDAEVRTFAEQCFVETVQTMHDLSHLQPPHSLVMQTGGESPDTIGSR